MFGNIVALYKCTLLVLLKIILQQEELTTRLLTDTIEYRMIEIDSGLLRSVLKVYDHSTSMHA